MHTEKIIWSVTVK